MGKPRIDIIGNMNRSDGRAPDQLRPISFESNFSKYAEGSVMARFGDTHVLCNVTLDDTIPSWLRNSAEPHGWLTAEYAMLPRSTQQRISREKRWPKGRTQEISRLIGRSLRMAVDLQSLGMRQIIVDCDVIQADGGTRTAAISGGWLAVCQALTPLIESGEIPATVLRRQIAAVSLGLVDGSTFLDLAYGEDVAAGVDLNLVMTADNEVIEIQGTAEKTPLSQGQLEQMIALGSKGIQEIIAVQRKGLGRRWTNL